MKQGGESSHFTGQIASMGKGVSVLQVSSGR